MLLQWGQSLHFRQCLVNMLRHFHICSELSKCVITSLWEIIFITIESKRVKCALRRRLVKSLLCVVSVIKES